MSEDKPKDEPNRLTVEGVGHAVVMHNAALVMALHRQLGLSIEAVQLDLDQHMPVHSDPNVAALAQEMTKALILTLGMSGGRFGRA